jgi:tRNA 2-thiouridine synthesizing protein B
MLHLVFQSPLETTTLERIGQGDAVLFLESTVLWLLVNSVHSTQLIQMLQNNRLFVLQQDLETRGISVTELINGIELIDYKRFVTLTMEYKTIQSWF